MQEILGIEKPLQFLQGELKERLQKVQRSWRWSFSFWTWILKCKQDSKSSQKIGNYFLSPVLRIKKIIEKGLIKRTKCTLPFELHSAIVSQQTFLVFEGVFSVTLFVFYVFQDIFAIRFPKMSSRRFQDVFKTSSKTCLQDVMQLCLQDVFKTSWKTKKCYTEDVFKTSWVCLHQDECLLGWMLTALSITISTSHLFFLLHMSLEV